MNNSGKENLLGFVSKQIHQIVHLVNGFKVLSVFLAPLRKQLFTEKVDKILNVLVIGKVHIFPRVGETHFDFIHQRTAH